MRGSLSPSPILIVIGLVLIELHNEYSFRHVPVCKWVFRGIKCEVVIFLSSGLACVHASQLNYL